jgi:hypothetical protein
MDPAIQQAGMMAAIGLAGTIAGLFFGWLRDREKYRYDLDVANLKSQNTTQAGQIATLTTQNATQAAQIAALTLTVNECQKQHRECEEKHRTSDARLAAVEDVLARLK